MKKYLVIGIGILILVSLVWMGYSSLSSLKEKDEKEATSKELTSMFSSLGIDAAIPAGVSMLMYFNSECEHCQWEVKELGENIDRFSDVNLAMVSLEPANSARNFLANHLLQNFFIPTKPENVMKTFSGGVPQIFIYDGNELKNKFQGEVKIEVLLAAIKEK